MILSDGDVMPLQSWVLLLLDSHDVKWGMHIVLCELLRSQSLSFTPNLITFLSSRQFWDSSGITRKIQMFFHGAYENTGRLFKCSTATKWHVVLPSLCSPAFPTRVRFYHFPRLTKNGITDHVRSQVLQYAIPGPLTSYKWDPLE